MNYKFGTSFHRITVALKQRSSYTTTSFNYVLSKSRLYEESFTAQLESMFRASSNSDSYTSVVKQVRQIHGQVVVGGMSNSLTLGSRILGMYVLCGKFNDAGNLFYRVEL